MMSNARGFTLIEMAIVIGVIGLIAGMIFLSGGTLFNSSKTAKTISIIQEIGEAINQFKTTYKAYPGDLDITGANEIPNVHLSCMDGNNDENIGSPNALESTCVVEHLFRAGLIKADGVDGAGRKLIESPFNGEVAVMHPSHSVASAVNWGRYVPVIVQINNLTCDVIDEIDRKIDDGSSDDGRARAIASDETEQISCSAGSTLVVAL